MGLLSAVRAVAKAATHVRLIHSSNVYQAHFNTHHVGYIPEIYNPAVNREIIQAQVAPREGGEATLELHITKRHIAFANTFGGLQGGIIACLHDLVASQAIRWTGLAGVHASMSFTYLNPVTLNEGDIVTGHARITRAGKSIGFVESVIHSNGNVASYGQHTFALKPVILENRKPDDASNSSNTVPSTQPSKTECTH